MNLISRKVLASYPEVMKVYCWLILKMEGLKDSGHIFLKMDRISKEWLVIMQRMDKELSQIIKWFTRETFLKIFLMGKENFKAKIGVLKGSLRRVEKSRVFWNGLNHQIVFKKMFTVENLMI